MSTKKKLLIAPLLIVLFYALYRFITALPYIERVFLDIKGMTINRPYNYDDLKMAELWGEFYVFMYHIKKLTPEDSTIYFESSYLDAQFDRHATDYFLYPRKIVKVDSLDSLSYQEVKHHYLFSFYKYYPKFLGSSAYMIPKMIDATPEIAAWSEDTGWNNPLLIEL